MEQQQGTPLAQGGFMATHRGCAPGREAEYFPIFNKMTEAIEAGDEAKAAEYREQLRPLQVVKSVDEFHNLVTNLGRNFALDTLLRGSAYTVAANLGLKGTGTVAAADTQGSHAGWSEVGGANAPAYTGNRKTLAFAAASGQSITHTPVTFAFTASGTVAGAFLNLAGSSTKDNTTGTLFSAADFSNGSKTVGNGDTIDVTYTLNG